MVSGVSVQVSGDMKIQRTVTKGGLFLFPVICYLTPETRHLTPKIKPYFVNYLQDPTTGPYTDGLKEISR